MIMACRHLNKGNMAAEKIREVRKVHPLLLQSEPEASERSSILICAVGQFYEAP